MKVVTVVKKCLELTEDSVQRLTWLLAKGNILLFFYEVVLFFYSL